MQRKAIQRILGLLLMLFSLTMLVPVLVSWIYRDGTMEAFFTAFGLTFLTGVLLWWPVHSYRRELRVRDGFLIVALFWSVLALFGALPFALTERPYMAVTDAVFESMSGLTTTGATIIKASIDDLPKSILYYRQQLQWLGGMGIIVLAVAVLPLLGIGGMQLYRAETPGPMKDTKLTPRITETAKVLWYIYLVLTVACAFGYWLAGMDGFDAVAHAYSTVSTGGFSTHDASIGYFDSVAIETVAVVFMLLSATNYALHFYSWRSLSLRPYLADSEWRTYLLVIAISSITTSAYLYLTQAFPDIGAALHHGIFQAVSFATTTGFTTAAYYFWPGFLPVSLIFTTFIGACAFSTGGGMKVIRFLLLYKQGLREIDRLIHPNAQLVVRIGERETPESVVEAVWGFFSLYVASFLVLMLVLMGLGLDQVTAFAAVAACINNTGPALGEASVHFGDLSLTAKWALCFAMLLGRLEIFTLLVLVTPAFWRR